MKIEPLWGGVQTAGDACLLDTGMGAGADIKSSLAICDWRPKRHVKITGTILETYASLQGGMGVWFLLGSGAEPWPAFYIRPRIGQGDWEFGWSNGPDPSDQVIGGTVIGEVYLPETKPPEFIIWISASEEGLAIDGPFSHLATFTKETIRLEWPPDWVGLYAEGCRAKLKVEEVET